MIAGNPGFARRFKGRRVRRREDLAERVGFEPTVRLPVHRISSAAHSTSLPPLREIASAA